MNRTRTPLPGQPVPMDSTLIFQFTQHFAPHWKRGPRWMWMPKGVLADSSWFEQPSVSDLKHVWFYIEGRELRSASPVEVRDYFTVQQPWDDARIYVFDKAFDWCFVSTGELSDQGSNDEMTIRQFVVMLDSHRGRHSEAGQRPGSVDA